MPGRQGGGGVRRGPSGRGEENEQSGQNRLTAPPVARLIVMLGVLFVSSSAILVRLSDVHHVAAAGYRMLFSVVLMLPAMLPRIRAGNGVRVSRAPLSAAPAGEAPPNNAQPNNAPPNNAQTNNAPAGSRVSGSLASARVWSVVSGVFLALHLGFWFKALQLTSVSSATVLVNTHPVFVTVLGWLLLRERVRPAAVLWMLVAMAAAAALALGGTGFGATAAEGNLLALSGAVFVSCYILIGRQVRRQLSVVHYTFLVYLTSAMVLILFAALTGVNLGPYPPREYGILVALAVFPTLLGHSVFSWALKYLKMSFVSTAVLGEPVFATILAMILFAEIPAISTVLFGLVVIFSIYRFTVADKPV